MISAENVSFTEIPDYDNRFFAFAKQIFIPVVELSNEIFVRKIPLPFGVRAFTLPDAQGDYNVYINERLSYEQQMKSLRHEELHILNGDCYSEKSAVEIERLMPARLISK